MIEVDVFWSYALGAAFAHCAGKGLAEKPNYYENWYFAYTVMFLSLIFAPSGCFLLNENPGWETMFVFDRNSFGARGWLEACIPTVFAHTNVLLGLIGFWVTYKLNKAGKRDLATYIWISTYSAFFGILGFGYGRFLYPGYAEDWAKQREYHWKDFLFCQTFNSLIGLGVFVLPALCVPLKWLSEGVPARVRSRDNKTILMGLAFNLVIQAVGYYAYLEHYGEAEKARVQHGFGLKIPEMEVHFKEYSPLFGCFMMTVLAGAAFVGPLIVWPTTSSVKEGKKRV
eukprot:Hpha_TRINITY_DN1855_c0_g1::TRINITY_DN1855_c0_g1_i1::g.170425::m.170425